MTLNYQFFEQNKNETPIVLIHGLFGKQDNLGLLKNHLIAQYPVITIDLRNHGLSSWSESMNYELMASDIFELLSFLNIQKATLIGHSMGGKVAMACALKQPEQVASLIVADMSPVTYTEHRHIAVLAALNAVAQQQPNSRKEADVVMQPFLGDLAVRQFLLKSFSATSPTRWQFNLETLEQHYQDIMDWPYDGLQFQGKTLFIKGGNSDYLLPEHQDIIRQQFPNAKAHIMSGCGHWLHAEKPSMFNQIISRFLGTE